MARDIWLELEGAAACWALHVQKNHAPEPEVGDFTFDPEFKAMGWGAWARTYQCCKSTSCSNWMWEDKICEGFVCRKCGLEWQKPTYGFSSRRSPTRFNRKQEMRQKPIPPPPGLGGNKNNRVTQAFKATTDLLTTSWSSLDVKLQQQLEQLGIKPQDPNPEPDLTDVLKENLSQLPAAVKELVEKITKPPPETERDMALKLKTQVSNLRDLSHRKQVLQNKLDTAKKTYGDMLEEMKNIQSKLEAEQGALNATSTAYMAMVNTNKPAEGLRDGVTMEDSVPAAVAGFINTLGVDLTEDQKAQLSSMLKRPTGENSDEENKRRRTAAGEPTLGG